jgi:hypothetical protein
MSVDGTMQALARYNFTGQNVRSVTSSGSQEFRQHERLWTNEVVPVSIGYWTIYQVTRVRYGIHYTMPSPLIAFLATTGFTNPINLGWELIPFSFVLDWFLPVGQYLEALSAWDGLDFKQGYKTTFTKREIRGIISFAGQYNSQLGSDRWELDQGAYARDEVLLSRQKLVSFPSPTIPSFKNGISTTHALNGLALLRAVFRG